MKNSNIEWTDHTFNAWMGCTKVSPACTNCYAERWAKRSGLVEWGPTAPRRRSSDAKWKEVIKWNQIARFNGTSERVFVNSLSDWAEDNPQLLEWRRDMWRLIKSCDSLTFLMLTKRADNIQRFLPEDWGHGYENVWHGVTVEDKDHLGRVDQLRQIQARARFLSIEPLLEDLGPIDLTGIHLVITGGESGGNARPSYPIWFRNIREQCVKAGVAFFHKQNGEYGPINRVKGEFLMASTSAADRWLKVRDDDILISGDQVRRIGKKNAGRLLDGQEWSQMPVLEPMSMEVSQ